MLQFHAFETLSLFVLKNWFHLLGVIYFCLWDIMGKNNDYQSNLHPRSNIELEMGYQPNLACSLQAITKTE
jgi:hypothetical protein